MNSWLSSKIIFIILIPSGNRSTKNSICIIQQSNISACDSCLNFNAFDFPISACQSYRLISILRWNIFFINLLCAKNIYNRSTSIIVWSIYLQMYEFIKILMLLVIFSHLASVKKLNLLYSYYSTITYFIFENWL